MVWPTPQEYNEAIQNTRLCFLDEELRGGDVALNNLGLPKAITGAFASVYDVTCGGKRYAVRCLLHDIPDQKYRYERLSRSICADSLECTVDFEYQHNGIKIHDLEFPIIKMEWIKGDTLDVFIHEHNAEVPKLLELHKQFRQMAVNLRIEGFAHGDLQHGNILIGADGLRLVDYDGMFVPALSGLQSNEVGHPNYQHPQRRREHFGPFLDNFSLWAIDTTLTCLIADPSFYHSLIRKGGESLFFLGADYRNPIASEVFFALEQHESDVVRRASRVFRTVLGCLPYNVPALCEDVPLAAELPRIVEMKAAAARLAEWALAEEIARKAEQQARLEAERKAAEQRKQEQTRTESGAIPAWLHDHSLEEASSVPVRPRITRTHLRAGTMQDTNVEGVEDQTIKPSPATRVGEDTLAKADVVASGGKVPPDLPDSPGVNAPGSAGALIENADNAGGAESADANPSSEARERIDPGGNDTQETQEPSLTEAEAGKALSEELARILHEEQMARLKDQLDKRVYFAEARHSSLAEYSVQVRNFGSEHGVFHLIGAPRDLALKIFCKEPGTLKDRYEVLRPELERMPMRAKKYFLQPEVIEEALLVDGNWYPGIATEWLGQAIGLDDFLRRRRPDFDYTLLTRFRRMVATLQSCGVTHGELVPSNILVLPDSDVMLVDNDSMSINGTPEARGSVLPPEYSHPGVQPGTHHSSDYFQAWLIDTMILCWSSAPRLWETFSAPDVLFFCKSDLASPDKSSLFEKMSTHYQYEISTRAEQLMGFCKLNEADVPRFSV